MQQERIDWRATVDKVTKYIGAGALATGLITGVWYGLKTSSIAEKEARKREPSLTQMLSSSDLLDSNLEFLTDGIEDGSLDFLLPYFKEIKDNEAKIEEQNPEAFGRFGSAKISSDMHRVSRRLGYAVLKSAFSEDEYTKKQESGNARISSTLLPADFFVRLHGELRGEITPDRTAQMAYSLTASQLDEAEREKHMVVGNSIFYVKKCILGETDSSAAGVFGRYFCDPREMLQAQIRAGTSSYFPVIENGKQIEGWRSHLPEFKRRLIDRALAYHYLTDPEGNLHLELLDSNNKPIKGLDAK